MSSTPQHTPEPLRVELTHAAILTAQLEEAAQFYKDIIGLRLRVMEEDPIRKGRNRAMLMDFAGNDVIEIIEMKELTNPSIPGRGGVHHIGFKFPERGWHDLRSRLDAASYPYHELAGRLFVRDFDNVVLEIEKG